jgi:hypothetical protein
MAQVVVFVRVEVFVAERDADDPLCHQRLHAVLEKSGIAAVPEAGGEAAPNLFCNMSASAPVALATISISKFRFDATNALPLPVTGQQRQLADRYFRRLEPVLAQLDGPG